MIPVVGWLLNMGHRIAMVHRMIHGKAAWPSTDSSTRACTWMELLRRGSSPGLAWCTTTCPPWCAARPTCSSSKRTIVRNKVRCLYCGTDALPKPFER